jgi:hypothetical protein
MGRRVTPTQEDQACSDPALALRLPLKRAVTTLLGSAAPGSQATERRLVGTSPTSAVLLAVAPRDTRTGVGVGRKTGSEAGEAIRWGHLFSGEDLNRRLLGECRVYGQSSQAVMPAAIKNFWAHRLSRCMVAVADRSPARYNFELNWRKMPSGPLTPRIVQPSNEFGLYKRPGQPVRALETCRRGVSR